MKLGKYIVIEKKELVNAVIQYAAWLTFFTISNKYDSSKKIALAITYTTIFFTWNTFWFNYYRLKKEKKLNKSLGN